MKKLTLLTLLFLAGCGDTVSVPEQAVYDSPKKIYVNITDNTGYKLYAEYLPLIYVQQLRSVTTNNNGDFTFNFDIPDEWSVYFESEPISFVSVGSDSVILNFDENTFYEFAITTK